MNRRVLFITYYFPPSGGPGVQRSLKFTRYLPDFGWTPTVLTVRPEAAAYPNLDPDLGAEIPEIVDVERTHSWDPYALYAGMLGRRKDDVVSVGFLEEGAPDLRHRVARWIRANLFLPDARVGWVPFAVARGNELLNGNRYDAILTTGPPHSTHLVGLLLTRRHRIPWLADFRDLWTEIDFYAELPMTDLARLIDRMLERAVLRRMTAGTVVTPAMKGRLRQALNRTLEVIENGFDPADFAFEKPVAWSNEFSISHVGNLNAARNPTVLWKALSDPAMRSVMPSLRVRLIGNVDASIDGSIREYGLSALVERQPYVPHDVAVRRMAASSLLLLVINRVPGAEGIATGKLYEYVASGRPVLGIGPVDGDAARVLRESGAGRMFDYEDIEGVRRFLEDHYAAWSTGSPVPGAGSEAAAPYSRRTQARQLAALLDAVAAER